MFSSSKSIENGSILSSHLLHIAHVKYLYSPQWSRLDHFFQFLEEMCKAMFMCSKRICYQVTVTWILVTQPFILHSHRKTILVVKIIVISQNSAHHHLQTTSKDGESVMCSYFFFITSHFYTLFITIFYSEVFSIFSSYFPLRCDLSERASPHLSQQEFFSPRASLYGIVGKHLLVFWG